MPEVGSKASLLEPFLFHGLDLSDDPEQAQGECPWCGKPKFSVKVKTGQWRCWSCREGNENGGGNVRQFFEILHKKAQERGVPYELKESRSLLDISTFAAWGVGVSPLSGEVVVPGYNHEGVLTQLYKYALPNPAAEKPTLMVAKGTHHALFGVPLFDPKKPKTWWVEGLWNAMVLYEVLRSTKWDGEKYVRTGSVESSLYSQINVIGVPGCTALNEKWLNLLDEQEVTIVYDSDHPSEKSGKMVEGAAYMGIKRVCRALSTSEATPKSVEYLKWGEDGYDPNLAHGFDVRDALKEGHTPSERVRMLAELMGKIEPVPSEWGKGKRKAGANGEVSIECVQCEDWKTLYQSGLRALKWTDNLTYGTVCCLATVVSTKAVGDQLWIKLCGPAACGKSTIAEALSVNKKYIYPKSTFKGFHSGYSDGSDKNYSPLGKMADKTLIVKDGDTILKSESKGKILSEARDIYDRVSRSSYLTDKSKDWEGINLTWILCGTGALRELDQSELGERFLTCIMMDEIDDDLEDEILWRKVNQAHRNMSIESNGFMETQHDPNILRFMQLAGGYVGYLRQNAQELLGAVGASDEVRRLITRFGKFVAYMRARPSPNHDETAEREFGTRLVSQLMRLAVCVTVVLNKREIDEEVMGYVRRVTFDTARGTPLKITKFLHDMGNKGASIGSIAKEVLKGEVETRKLIKFLIEIKAVVLRSTPPGEVKPGVTPVKKYVLSDTMNRLYESVIVQPQQQEVDADA